MIRIDVKVTWPDGRTVSVNDAAESDGDLDEAAVRACRILRVRIDQGEDDREPQDG